MIKQSHLTELFDLSNHVAIVTGSGRGLGAVIARGLAAAGASVMLCSRTQAELDSTAAEIAGAGGDVATTVVDTSNRESCQRLIDQTVARFGRVDVLVNNAGIDVISPAEAVTDDGSAPSPGDTAIITRKTDKLLHLVMPAKPVQT